MFTTQLLKNQKRNLKFCAFQAETHTLTLFGNVENKCCIFWLALGCCTLQKLVKIYLFPFSQDFEAKITVFRVLDQCLRIRQKCVNFFLIFCYFYIKILWKHMKNVKKQISDSVWFAHHPNAGWNIQHMSPKTNENTPNY